MPSVGQREAKPKETNKQTSYLEKIDIRELELDSAKS